MHQETGRIDSEDGLLLREFSHRVANQLASVMAALLLMKGDRRPPPGVMDETLRRLQHCADVNRMLAAPLRGGVDISKLLDELCVGLLGARTASHAINFRLVVPPIFLASALARRIALIAAELIVNAQRHAFEARGGTLRVGLLVDNDFVELEVADDGPGFNAEPVASSTGYGRGILAELVARGGGRMSVDTGPSGTTVRVRLPLDEVNVDEDSVF